MKVKLKKTKKFYIPVRINRYNEYRDKLKLIFSKNTHADDFMFYGMKEFPTERYGILVCGLDGMGVSEFQQFYSLRDINLFFHQLNEGR